MGYYQLANEIPGIGRTLNSGNKKGIITGAFLLPTNQVFGTTSTIRLEATIDALIAAKQCYPLQGVKEVEVIMGEDKVYTSPTDEVIDLAPGLITVKLKCFLDEDQIRALYQWEGKNWTVAYFDSNNNLVLRKVSTNYYGFNIKRFKVKTLTEATKDTPAWVEVSIQEADPNERRLYATTCVPAYTCMSKWGVTKVIITPGLIIANVVIVTVASLSDTIISDENVLETFPITGLVAANFSAFDTSANPDASETIVSVSESTTVPGTYTITMTAITAGTIRVVPSTSQLFESEDTVIASA